MASAASTDFVGTGSASATACTTGAAAAGRCAIITELGSTASTVCGGSYAPAPAPMLTTVAVEPRADPIAAAIRGSGCRVRRYVRPILSYSATDTWSQYPHST